MQNGQYSTGDLLVFSHLRWDFVFQRPQHILSRFAKHRRVFFFEEPVFVEDALPSLKISQADYGVQVVVPHVTTGLDEEKTRYQLQNLVDRLVREQKIVDFTAWYYTPMALPFTQNLKPSSVVYDCMDELSLFKGAHPQLLKWEAELMRQADVVFTGGYSLFEFKQSLHDNIHPVPSSIDHVHFAQARQIQAEPEDQKIYRGTKIGFFGVIDERFDIDLVEGVAKLRPDWHIMLIGPVVKIDPATLPLLPNIHYLGKKSYKELPAYVSHWDCAILPFARNNSTRFISPTKTPEYLAAGKPVVSTAIRDVIRPYALQKLVRIANEPAEFVQQIESAVDEASPQWLERVDSFLAKNSWDNTCVKMAKLELDARMARSMASSILQASAEETKLGA